MNAHGLLAVHGLTDNFLSYKILKPLSFTLPIGGSIFLQGANGSGKTTLLHLLATLVSSEGDVFFSGSHISADLDLYKENIAFLGHKVGLIPYLTVKQQLKWLRSFANAKSANENNYSNALEKLGLLKLLSANTASLSTGQQRKLAFAGLLMQGAKIWLLDEPFANLDKTAIAEVLTLCDAFCRAGGGIIYSSHIDIMINAQTTTLVMPAEDE